MNNIEIPKLSETEQAVCEGYVTKSECEQAIKSMKVNKSPRDDGIPIEFYTTFWIDINQILIAMFNESFDSKELPTSLQRAVISLIFKKGKKEDIANYRPISLANIDYKILAFVWQLDYKKFFQILLGQNKGHT